MPYHHDEIHMDPFTRRHVGSNGAFVLRANPRHVRIACAAIANRLDVPLGSLSVDWAAVKGKAPVRLVRKAA